MHPLSIARAAGPVAAILVWLLFPERSVHVKEAATAAVAVWMGIWWLTEAIPLAVTALLPLVFFPFFGVMSAREIAPLYTNDIVFLFVGGFLVALAMERWNLHKRIALMIVSLLGGGPRRTLLGFMAATAALSMWISNTATAMMMVPIAGAVLKQYDTMVEGARQRSVGVGLMLGIAYSASVGGIATLVGTPPNLAFAQLFHMQFPQAPDVSFARWIVFALPLSLVMLVVVWGLLVLLHFRGLPQMGARRVFRDQLKALGTWSREEKLVSLVFAGLALSWLTRKPLELGLFTLPGWSQLLPEPEFVGDGTAAIAWGALLFLLPSRRKGQPLMNWETARGLPWRIVLLFGGGFALAGAIQASGLAPWIGERMEGLSGLPAPLMTASTSTLMTFLTELTSNTATTQMALPILGALAVAIKANPYFLMVPATLSASCAFMMPVATPPNAIVFGTGRLRIIDMARTGILLNLIGIALITLWVHLAGPSAFGGGADTLPGWAVGGG
ncbi:DASS family sodium-coupled anion symporter [bacterium]|nr:DASS family sodium-coupled anion symporter [bacterium]